MKCNGRTLDHITLETLRLLAVERVRGREAGERLREKTDAQLAAIKAAPKLAWSFFRVPRVAYVASW